VNTALRTPLPIAFALALLLAPLASCRGAYYATMETFGKHKRDLLVDEVESGRKEQAAAQELIGDMERAIREADEFLRAMEG
jgi:hypothetical protein